MDVVTRVRAAIELHQRGWQPASRRQDQVLHNDRGDLVVITVRTVMQHTLFGIALIFLIQWVFRLHLLLRLDLLRRPSPSPRSLAPIITVLRGELGQPSVGWRD